MTDTAIKELADNAERQNRAAFRYLAFLETEREGLLRELFPDHKKGDSHFVQSDTGVHRMSADTSPLEGAMPVLTTVGVDLFADDRWCDFLSSVVCRDGAIGCEPEEITPTARLPRWVVHWAPSRGGA